MHSRIYDIHWEIINNSLLNAHELECAKLEGRNPPFSSNHRFEILQQQVHIIIQLHHKQNITQVCHQNIYP